MIVQLNERLISDVAACPVENFSSLLELDLHLREDQYQGKIRKIENLSLVPNLRRLNLSYNVITKIEGLDRMVYLTELNLAENSIRKIENLDNLKSLEKLNLSGNEIERIPPNIRQLHQLNHLRITRNNLTHLEDLQHLSQLPYLTNLRFDENPFCSDPNYELFAIYHIPTLTFVNGREITDDMREEARLKFATSQRDILCSKLEAEKHKLIRLKRNLQRSPMRNEFRAQESSEENELLMAQKLEEISLVEKEIFRLQELIDRFDHGSTGNSMNDQSSSTSPLRSRAQTPSQSNVTASRNSTSSDHSPPPLTRDDFDRLKSSISTPFRSHFDGGSVSHIRTPTHGESLAAKQITELNDRVEKLASKILTAEKEKSGLKKELDARRKSDNLVSRLKEELMRTEEALEKALSTAQDANTELETVRQELSLTKHELHAVNEDMIHCMQNNRDLSEENKQLTQEKGDLLKLLESKEKKESNYTPNKGIRNFLAADDHFNLLELERINLHLQAELDRHLTESTTLNQHLNRLRNELDATKMKLQQSESTVREQKLEKQSFERNIQALQNERSNLERTIGTLASNIKGLESDLAAVIRAKTNTPMKTLSETRRMRNHTPHVKNRSAQNQSIRGTFLDTWSIESESGFLGGKEDFDDEENDAVSEQQPRYLERVLLSSGKKKKENNPSAVNPIFGQQGGLSKFSLTELERSAAEIMAHIMLEEIQQGSNPFDNSNSSSPLKHSKQQNKKDSHTTNNGSALLLRHDLKDACIRAALRLVYTTTHLIQDPDLQQAMAEELDIHSSDKINLDKEEDNYSNNTNRTIRAKKSVTFTPFHALGDRHVLSKLVAETHAGLSAMEEAGIIREEINQLEKLARELELRAETADQSIIEKENTLKGLQRHAEEAKRQAEDTLQELENLHKKLQIGRDEIVRLDNEQSMLKREVDIARGQMKDISALSEIEQRNLQTLRSKLHDTKRDFHELEVSLSTLKEENAKEENKLRSTRAASSEQMRLLSLDANKAQNDLKAKQRAMEDLEKQRRLLEEEMDTKRRDSELYLSQLLREGDEENRKLSSFKNETRLLRNEMDTLMNKKKQAEHELSTLQEKLMAEKSMAENEHLENRRKLEQDERLAQDLDRRVKTHKEKLNMYEVEQAALRHANEELRRQQHDLDRALDQKKRSSETELQQAQQAVQFATRSLRQLSTQIEQRQHEYDAINNDVRTLERRHEEMKRLMRDQEHQQEQCKEQQKHLDLEKANLMKDIMELKKEEKDLKHTTLLLKTSLDTETRQLEEMRRKSLQLSQDAQHWQDSEHRNKQSYNVLQTEMDTLQQEVANVRSQQDRERRILSELTAKRAFLEAELNRQDVTFRNMQSLHQEENHRVQDMEQTILKSIEEVNRVQTLLVTMEKKIDEAKRREEESHQKEQLIKQSILKLQLEKDGLHAMYLTEKRHADELKEHSFQLQQEYHRLQEEHATLILQAKERRQEIDTLQKHLDHQVSVKSSLEQEIHRLQDVSKWEEKRFTLVSEQYQQLEQRLHALRTELEKVQAVYEKTKYETVEEQRRTETQRVLLQETLSEIASLESQMAQIQRQMAREKQQAMQEIGHLQNVKTLTEQEILRLGETQKRLDPYQQLSTTRNVLPSSSSSSSSQFRSKGIDNYVSNSNNHSGRGRSRSPAATSSMASKFTVTTLTPPVVAHVHQLPNNDNRSNSLGDLKQDRNKQHLVGSLAGEMLRLKVSLTDTIDNTNYFHHNNSIMEKNMQQDEQTKRKEQEKKDNNGVFQRRGRWVAHHHEQQQSSRSVSQSRRDSLDENPDDDDKEEDETNTDTARSDDIMKTSSHKNVHFSGDDNKNHNNKDNNLSLFQQMKPINIVAREESVTVDSVENNNESEKEEDVLWMERDSLGGLPGSAIHDDILRQANASLTFDETNSSKRDFKLIETDDEFYGHHYFPNNSNIHSNISTTTANNMDENTTKDSGLSALQEAMAKLRQQSEAVLAQSQHL